MRCCWLAYARPTGSIGPVASSILPPFVLWVRVKNRTQSHRSRTPRLQAPPDHRSAGHSVGRHPDRRQSQRRNPTFALGRSHSTYSWQAGAPTLQAPHHPGRPWLRSRQVPPAPSRSRHQNRDRPAQHAARQRLGQNPLGGRANHRLAPQLPTPAGPIRTIGRHSRSLYQDRLQPYLLAKTELRGKLILLELLSLR